ncbi:MAG: hypothetical protein K8823_1559 [Cenarchaeum symbiont of Oopsacas minuta]|nr:hypothetical protein [Cenarchaeum symbiont of Oopsacas minuta]
MANGLEYVMIPRKSGNIVYEQSPDKSAQMQDREDRLSYEKGIARVVRQKTSHQASLDKIAMDSVMEPFLGDTVVGDNLLKTINPGYQAALEIPATTDFGKAFVQAKQAAKLDEGSLIARQAGAKQAYDNATIPGPATLEHLRRVMLIPDMLGRPRTAFYLKNFFQETPVPTLIARQPLTGFYEQQGAVPRGGRINESNQTFAEIQYELEKYPIMINVPIEDRISTQISYPDELKMNLQFAREKRHNDEALKEMLNITTEFSMSTLGGLGSNYHSPNSGPKRMIELTVQWYNLHRSIIDTVAMAPSLFTKWIENTWAYNVTGPWKTRKFAGITPLPGLDNITCIIDPALEANHSQRIFCVDKRNGARYGQGPIITKSFDDPYYASSGEVMYEFFQYKVVDGKSIVSASDPSTYDRKYSFYITVAI